MFTSDNMAHVVMFFHEYAQLVVDPVGFIFGPALKTAFCPAPTHTVSGR